MGNLMEDIIGTAEGFVKNFSGDSAPPFLKNAVFDYSAESLETVDRLLEEFSEFAHDFEHDDDALFDCVSMVGCYVFEVARRNYGGEYFWTEEEQPVLVAGLPDFRVQISAWEKVKGRILNGEEDNIPFYIAGYREHIEHAKKGDFLIIT